jgi:hypothetical protein
MGPLPERVIDLAALPRPALSFLDESTEASNVAVERRSLN